MRFLIFWWSIIVLADQVLYSGSLPTTSTPTPTAKPMTKKPIKHKPTMVGEPLTPFDYENGIKLVIDAALAKNMSINDGTMNDMILPRKSLLRAGNTKLWPEAIVPYLLDDKFTETEKAMIAKGIQLIESQSCVQIIPRTTEENYVLVRKNLNSSGCSSSVGMKGGKQTVNLAARCVIRFGSTSHEFMHALGFYHEQSRPDRDDHVVVHYQNIAKGYAGQFNKIEGEYANLAAGYDTKSITHYGNGADSKNGKHTMDPKNGTGQLGQREGLTELDVEKINNYYSCKNKNKTSSRSFDDSEDNSDNETSEEISPNSNRGILPFICVDLDPVSCQIWATFGFCQKSQLFMSVYCKAACKKCDVGCTDMNKQCKAWAKKKYCGKYWHYMYLYCPVSCKKCPAAPQIPLLPTEPPTTAPALTAEPTTTVVPTVTNQGCFLPFCIIG